MTARALVGPALLALVACGGGEPAIGVQHLDFTLADGRSSAAVLSAKRGVVRELTGDWRFGDPDTPSVDGVASDWKGSLTGELAVGAREVDVVELDVEVGATGPIYLQWRPSEDTAPEREWPAGQYLAARVRGNGVETVQFSVGEHPAWWGSDVGRWRVSLASGRLRAVRFVQVGFVLGDEPHENDGGLVAIERDARRVFPSDAGALVAAARVPRSGRFAASLALTGSVEVDAVEVRVRLRTGSGTWREVGRSTARRGGWSPIECDLARYAGDVVELSLETGGDVTSEPARARVLWANPRITGELVRDRRPDIALVTLDTTRADAVGEGRHTPVLDRMAEGALVFSNAYAPTNSTQPSHTSLFTGVAMQDHGVVDNYSRLPERAITVAERLRGAGYLTAAAVSQPCLGLGTGLARGFDRFLQPSDRSHLDGRGTIEGVRRWIAETTDAPLFLWVHLYDPHTPYAPPEDFLREYPPEEPARRVTPPTLPELDRWPPDREFLTGTTSLAHARFLYAAGVSYADRLLGELEVTFEQAGRADDTVWIITADHGESLGERGSFFNHLGLFPETTRVPLFVRLPDASLSGEIEALVSGVDVAPTLLELAGVFDRLPSRGESLLRAARQGVAPDRLVWFEHSSNHQVGCTDGRHYFVTTLTDKMTFGHEPRRDPEGRRVSVAPRVARGATWLFDLEADPGLENDLSETEPELLERFRGELERWRATAGGLEAEARDMTPEEEAAISNLGYADQRD